jgi:EAL domain-containing protein (putative c-di-GMP-specific phosphodiesterase class I)
VSDSSQVDSPVAVDPSPQGRVNVIVVGASALAAASAFLAALAVVPHLPRIQPALPVFYAVATCAALTSAYLLSIRSRRRPDDRLAWAAWGYGLASAAMGLQILGFPGFFPGGGLLGTTSTGAAALYLLWHVALPVAVLAADHTWCHHRYRRVAFGAAGLAGMLYVSWGGAALPALLAADGRYTMTLKVALAALVPLSVVALVAWMRAAGPRPPWTDAWVSVSLAFSTWDVLLHAFADERFTAPWWGSLSMRLAQYVVLAAGLLAGFAALHRALERHDRALTARLTHARRRDEHEQRERSAARARVQAVLADDALRIVFQPIFDLATGRAIGAEALARFDTEPRRPPNVWFAEAAAVGLGVELELLAVHRALSRLAQLDADLYLTLNVSPAAVCSRRLDAVFDTVDARRIVVELTEHDQVVDYDELIGALTTLRTRGVRLAIDDVGAGFSGLNRIARLRPELIKLDLDLTRHIDIDPAQQALTTALVAFAAATGTTIIAEGIETPSELDALRHLDVAGGQGYLLGRPGDLPLQTLFANPIHAAL